MICSYIELFNTQLRISDKQLELYCTKLKQNISLIDIYLLYIYLEFREKMCCFLTSCCCGWQSLEQGLFILALVDILFNILVIGFNISSTFSGFASLSGALIIADIGLAVGAKLGVVNSSFYNLRKHLKGTVRLCKLTSLSKSLHVRFTMIPLFGEQF